MVLFMWYYDCPYILFEASVTKNFLSPLALSVFALSFMPRVKMYRMGRGSMELHIPSKYKAHNKRKFIARFISCFFYRLLLDSNHLRS